MRRVMMNAKRGWTHLAFVESETEADVEYEIKRHDDGRTGCACHAYVFAKVRPKSCKHVEALLVTPGLRDRSVPEMSKNLHASVLVGSERFRVRRAISLRPLTAAGLRGAR